MSSELIGELGQVGLRIGEPMPQNAVDDEENQAMDDGLSDDSAVSGPTTKRSRVSSTRPKRFRSQWMMFDIFKDWLRPHPNPELASCIVCSRVIKAGKSELEKHATGKRHLKMLREQQQGVVLINSGDTSADLESFTLDESGTASGNDGKQQFIMYRDFEHQYSAEQHENTGDVSAVESYAPGIYVPVQERAVQQPAEASRSSGPSRLFVTKPAPHWKATAIVNGHVTRLDVNDYKGRYVVLFFYAHNFSKVDASEINRLSDRIAEFRNVQTEIVACSTDSHLSHLTWVKKARGEGGVAGTKIPLIADPTHVISKEYGVYVPEKGHNLRAHFVIDRRGILRHMAINDPLIGRGTDELLRIVKALQFSDTVEEPLIADWTPEA
uniref:thioredoxin-dependent peroxiredoxin n=1 Tax=Lygus hesperus TaxID=30085 RepID=A0A0A9WGY2_LYGHE